MDKTMSDEVFYRWANYEFVVHRSDQRIANSPTPKKTKSELKDTECDTQ